MDLLQQASEWLEDRRTEFAARQVTYRRGNSAVELAATVGRTVFEIDNGYGVVQKVESRDYLIRALDLVLNGELTRPERGDRIRETDGTMVFVYEVLAPGQEPAWRFSDPYRKTLRIHTKQVDTETN